MNGGSKGEGQPGRGRVHWAPRGRRRWCTGAARCVENADAHASMGRTVFLHWQAMLDALRRRGAKESIAVLGDEAIAAPRPALPDRRRRAKEGVPTLDDRLGPPTDSTTGAR